MPQKILVRKLVRIWSILLIFGLTSLLALQASGQEAEIRPVSVEQPMPDFTLEVYQGGSLSLSQLRGKNVLIVFPRGYAALDVWCTICSYKYVELARAEKEKSVRSRLNTEILIVFPYDRQTVKLWLESLPSQLAKIHDWKYPTDPASLDESGKRRQQRASLLFPEDLSLKPGEIPIPFPILLDSDKKLSRGLGIYSEDWGGSKVPQNIPTEFIVDKKGIVQFKYFAQNTADRPSLNYILKMLDIINSK